MNEEVERTLSKPFIWKSVWWLSIFYTRPMFSHSALKMEAAMFSDMLANQPTTSWYNHQRMETWWNCYESWKTLQVLNNTWCVSDWYTFGKGRV